MFRIGFGFDTHRLEPGYPFLLGGVTVDHDKGLVGHSDADVLIHAIIDALLGAAALRDIGSQFPDTDPALKGADSKLLLQQTMKMVRERNYMIGNIDCTIVLQRPKIAALVPSMVASLAGVMEIEEYCISVKAKTSEKLGFIGREEGVSAYAVVLLTSKQTS